MEVDEETAISFADVLREPKPQKMLIAILLPSK
jgi:hypothetical protein